MRTMSGRCRGLNCERNKNKTNGFSGDGGDPIPPSFLYTMIPLNLVVGVTIIILNSLVGHFYRRGKRSTAALLYTYLTGWDVTMSVTAVIHAVYMIITVTSDVKAKEETMKVLVCIVYVMTNLAVRLSVFANTVLSVVRTINISQPFYRVRRRNLHIVYWVCFAIHLILCAVDIWFVKVKEKILQHSVFSFTFETFRNDMLLSPALGNNILDEMIYKRPGTTLKRDTLVSNGFFHLATLIAIICLAIQSRVLLCNPDAKAMRKDAASSRVAPAPSTKQPEEHDSKTEDSEKQSSEWRTTITIIQLTTVFCLCNTVYTLFVIWLLDDTKRRVRGEVSNIEMSDRMCFYVTSTFVPFLNSLINPLILIMRSDGVRQFVKTKLGF